MLGRSQSPPTDWAKGVGESLVANLLLWAGKTKPDYQRGRQALEWLMVDLPGISREPELFLPFISGVREKLQAEEFFKDKKEGQKADNFVEKLRDKKNFNSKEDWIEEVGWTLVYEFSKLAVKAENFQENAKVCLREMDTFLAEIAGNEELQKPGMASGFIDGTALGLEDNVFIGRVFI